VQRDADGSLLPTLGTYQGRSRRQGVEPGRPGRYWRERRSPKVGAFQLRPTQVGRIQIGIFEVSVAKVGVAQIGGVEAGVAEPSIPQVCLAEVGTWKAGGRQAGEVEISAAEMLPPPGRNT
jgi:hypothetical protein